MTEPALSIVHCPSTSAAPSFDEPQTPFHAFMNALLSTRTAQVTTMAGAALWSAFPVEQAVADGLWPVMLKAAQKADAKLYTELQVGAFAPIVDRLLSAGIMLAYDGPEEAASAFIRDIVDPAIDGMSAGEVSVRPWMKPATQFFARLVRTALEYGTEMDAMFRRFEEDKRIIDHPVFDTYLDASIRYVPGELGLRSDSGMDVAYHLLRRDRDSLVRKMADLAAFRKIPLLKRGMPKDAYLQAVSLEEGWMNTQLLRAAAGLPDSDFLESHEYAKCRKAFGKRTADDLARLLIERIERRGAHLTPSDRETLRGIALERCGQLSSWPAMLDPSTARMLSLMVTSRIAHMTQSEALETAMDDEGLSDRHLLDRTGVAKTVPWKTVSAADFARIISARFLTRDQIVAGIKKAPKRRRKDLVDVLLRSDLADVALAASLARDGLVTIDAPFIEEFPRLVPSDAVVKHLPMLLDHLGLEDRIGFVLRMEDATARELFSRPDMRLRLFDGFIVEAVEGIFPSDATFKALREKIGSADWFLYVLASDVTLREETFAEFAERTHDGKDSPLLPWAKILDEPSVEANILCRRLDLDRATASGLVSKWPEEKLLAWLLETDDGRDERLRRFVENRDRYFRDLEAR